MILRRLGGAVQSRLDGKISVILRREGGWRALGELVRMQVWCMSHTCQRGRAMRLELAHLLQQGVDCNVEPVKSMMFAFLPLFSLCVGVFDLIKTVA
jgi:hypothetical protein